MGGSLPGALRTASGAGRNLHCEGRGVGRVQKAGRMLGTARNWARQRGGERERRGLLRVQRPWGTGTGRGWVLYPRDPPRGQMQLLAPAPPLPVRPPTRCSPVQVPVTEPASDGSPAPAQLFVGMNTQSSRAGGRAQHAGRASPVWTPAGPGAVRREPWAKLPGAGESVPAAQGKPALQTQLGRNSSPRPVLGGRQPQRGPKGLQEWPLHPLHRTAARDAGVCPPRPYRGVPAPSSRWISAPG